MFSCHLKLELLRREREEAQEERRKEEEGNLEHKGGKEKERRS